MESNLKDKVVFASPRSEEERGIVAGACVRKLGIEIPAVLDEFGNSTESAYPACGIDQVEAIRPGRVEIGRAHV